MISVFIQKSCITVKQYSLSITLQYILITQFETQNTFRFYHIYHMTNGTLMYLIIIIIDIFTFLSGILHFDHERHINITWIYLIIIIIDIFTFLSGNIGLWSSKSYGQVNEACHCIFSAWGWSVIMSRHELHLNIGYSIFFLKSCEQWI